MPNLSKAKMLKISRKAARITVRRSNTINKKSTERSRL